MNLLLKHNAILLLGTNLGNKVQNLNNCLEKIELNCQITIMQKSSVYETEPWGFESNESFLNQALWLKTTFTADLLLKYTKQIELDLGRKEKSNGSYTSRIIDIDILYYDSEIINTNSLKIPHPRIAERRFTLEPLAEIIPHYVNPVSNISNIDLLKKCTDKSEVKKLV